MSIIKDVEAAYLSAYKSRDEFNVGVLRMLKAALKNKLIELMKPELEDAEAIAVIRSEMKKRQDSVESFIAGNRPELAEKEKNEALVLEKFLPAAMGKDELLAKVVKIVDAIPEADRINFGKVMSAVMAELKGSADGGTIGAVVKEVLARK